jgi:hypothetical protein
MLRRPVVPELDVCSIAEEVHRAVEGHSHRRLPADLVKKTIFPDTGNSAEILFLLVDPLTEEGFRLFEEWECLPW